MYRIKASSEIHSFIRSLHPQIKRKIRYGINEILSNPETGKYLKNELAGLQSYRISRFRIIYRKSSKIIELVAIGPRKNIYIETAELIKKDERADD